MSMSSSEYAKSTLWEALVETAHALPMYKHHKRYVGEVILREKPEIGAKELALLINVPFGEAIVLIEELGAQGKQEPAPTATRKPTTPTSLFEFSAKPEQHRG